MAKKRKFLDFMDRFDGGGAGKMGDEFEGGGLLSAFANMAASPYGSEDEMRRKARQDFYSSQNIGGGSQGGSARVSRPVATQMPMVEPPMNAFPGMQDMRRSGQFNPDAPVPSFPPNMSGAPAAGYAPAAQTAPPIAFDNIEAMRPSFGGVEGRSVPVDEFVASMPDLVAFAQKHNVKIDDILDYYRRKVSSSIPFGIPQN